MGTRTIPGWVCWAPLSDVPVLPAFQIIETIADQEPGADGD